MRPRFLGIVIVCFVIAAIAAAFHTQAAPAGKDYVEGEVLVRFNASETLDTARQVATRHGCALTRHFDWLSRHEGRVIGLIHSSKLTTAELLSGLGSDPGVAYVEPNYLRYITDIHTPNDPNFGQLWGLQNTGQNVAGTTGTANADIEFLRAWGLARPSTNEVVVGVIDTGLDVTHPDIVSNLWTNPGEIPGNGIDDDNNGYVDDVHGYDFALGTGTITDAGVHGSHVSGTIAATGNNGIGVIGVDYQAHIMALKASSDGSTLTTAAEVAALQYATMMKGRGVNIVALNASYGGGNSSVTERSAIQAAGDAGIVFCAAAGNNSANNDATPFYPASYRLNNMIVVAASDQNDALASFSDYGATTVDLAAPGVNILSLLPLSQVGTATYVQQGSTVFSANPMTYSGLTSLNGTTATVYNCGLGNPADFPGGVRNNIALIQRGTLTFAAKVSNAMNAGALAAVIYNNAPGNYFGTLGSAGNWIPCVSLSQADGQTLLAALPTTATVVNAPDPTQIYQYLSGTSMATPHVSGAVAFAALNFPAESVAQRIQRVITHTQPVAALAGRVASGGRLDLARSVDTDGNGLPDWWELQYFGHLTGTDPGADPDHDGESNLAEFLAGTDPTNPFSVLELMVQPLEGGGALRLEWPSVAGHSYRLLRSASLVGNFNTLVQTNILATPPLNVLTDTPPAGLENVFYQLELEQ
jgi:subtilisin family serine protease